LRATPVVADHCDLAHIQLGEELRRGGERGEGEAGVVGHRRGVRAERQLRDGSAVAIPEAGGDSVAPSAVHQHLVQRRHDGPSPPVSPYVRPAAVGHGSRIPGPRSEGQFVRYAKEHLTPWFRYPPERAGYNKRLRRSGEMLQHVLGAMARDCPSYHSEPTRPAQRFLRPFRQISSVEYSDGWLNRHPRAGTGGRPVGWCSV
jgi:hypothetical protein